MFRKVSPLLVAFGLVSLGVIAHADAFDYEIANVLLLQNKTIQKDMGVDEAQRGRLNQVAAWFDDQQKQQLAAYKAQHQKNPKAKPDDAKITATQMEFKKRVMAQLSAGQIRRLREITIQAAGYDALTDKRVSAKLNLTSAQTKSISTLHKSFATKAESLQKQAYGIKRTAAQNALKPLPKNADDKTKQAKVDAAEKAVEPQLEALGSQLESAMNSYNAGVEKVLSAAQVSGFKALQGPPVAK